MQQQKQSVSMNIKKKNKIIYNTTKQWQNLNRFWSSKKDSDLNE